MTELQSPDVPASVQSGNEADKARLSTSHRTARPRWLPGLVLVALFWLMYQSVRLFAESNYAVFTAKFFGPMVTWVLFMIAWLGFSRRTWTERLGGLAMFVVTAALASWLAHPTMKFGLILYGLPVLLTAWAIWGWVTRNWTSLRHRQATLAATMLFSAAYFCSLRLDGVDGGMNSELSWRWAATAEEKFLATVR